MSPKFFESNVMTQAPSFSAMNNMSQDVLVKEAKPDPVEMARLQADIEAKEATKFQLGMVAVALVAAVGLSALSSAGAVIAIGTGLYIGGRVLKALIAKHIKDKDREE